MAEIKVTPLDLYKTASKTADCVKVCPVCLETRQLTIAGRCKHSVCTECLATAMGRADGEVYKCPVCQADCPRPWDGVKGLVDFTGEYVDVEERKDLQVVLDVRCKICLHKIKKRVVQAVNLCVECKNLYICGDCTKVHAKNKTTKGHTVIPFQPEKPKQEAFCKEHNSSLDSYCIECKQAVCVVCVMLEHGDHTVEKIRELVDANVDVLKVILEERQKRMKKLEDLEKELILLRRTAPLVDKQDILVKEIEDHAQKCIDKIVKWKNFLEKRVKVDYQIIRDIPECLKKVSEVVRKMQEPIQRAEDLLAETEHQAVYLDRLMALQKDLEALAETGDNVQGEGYTDQLRELHNQDFCFAPCAINPILGTIEKTQAEQAEFKQIFWDTMREDPGKFIPCIANLGQRFAIAHPTGEGEPSNAVDIYEFPGKLMHTFRDHVPPLYDMSATPDGKLAMLSDGTRDTSRCVKLFDSQTGHISSTRDFDIAKPLSLGVTLRHRYVILGDNDQGKRQITVVDKDGRVEHTYVIKEEIGKKGIEPTRITCGGGFNFVSGKLGSFAFELKDAGIESIKRCLYSTTVPVDIEGVDISADMWDNLSTTYISKNYCYLDYWKKSEEKWRMTKRWSEWSLVSARGADRETRVSRRGSHIVMSDVQTIRVFKE